LTNYGIEEDKDEPKEPAHADYKYLKSAEGPLAKQLEASDKEQASENEKDKLLSKRGSKSKPFVAKSFERKKFGGIRMCQRCLRTKVSLEIMLSLLGLRFFTEHPS
jgi:hypothetical protein